MDLQLWLVFALVSKPNKLMCVHDAAGVDVAIQSHKEVTHLVVRNSQGLAALPMVAMDCLAALLVAWQHHLPTNKHQGPHKASPYVVMRAWKEHCQWRQQAGLLLTRRTCNS